MEIRNQREREERESSENDGGNDGDNDDSNEIERSGRNDENMKNNANSTNSKRRNSKTEKDEREPMEGINRYGNSEKKAIDPSYAASVAADVDYSLDLRAAVIYLFAYTVDEALLSYGCVPVSCIHGVLIEYYLFHSSTRDNVLYTIQALSAHYLSSNIMFDADVLTLLFVFLRHERAAGKAIRKEKADSFVSTILRNFSMHKGLIGRLISENAGNKNIYTYTNPDIKKLANVSSNSSYGTSNSKLTSNNLGGSSRRLMGGSNNSSANNSNNSSVDNLFHDDSSAQIDTVLLYFLNSKADDAVVYDIAVILFQTVQHGVQASDALNAAVILQMVKIINKSTKNEDIDNITKYIVGVILERYSMGSDPSFVQTLYTELQNTEMVDVVHLMSKLRFKKQTGLHISHEALSRKKKGDNVTDIGDIKRMKYVRKSSNVTASSYTDGIDASGSKNPNNEDGGVGDDISRDNNKTKEGVILAEKLDKKIDKKTGKKVEIQKEVEKEKEIEKDMKDTKDVKDMKESKKAKKDKSFTMKRGDSDRDSNAVVNGIKVEKFPDSVNKWMPILVNDKKEKKHEDFVSLFNLEVLRYDRLERSEIISVQPYSKIFKNYDFLSPDQVVKSMLKESPRAADKGDSTAEKPADAGKGADLNDKKGSLDKTEKNEITGKKGKVEDVKNRDEKRKESPKRPKSPPMTKKTKNKKKISKSNNNNDGDNEDDNDDENDDGNDDNDNSNDNTHDDLNSIDGGNNNDIDMAVSGDAHYNNDFEDYNPENNDDNIVTTTQ